MNTDRIAIIGAGLSGLYAAYLLEQKGIRDYVLIEARDAPGGRIASFPAPGFTGDDPETKPEPVNGFDLGPTWFWPDLQPQLGRLIECLGLERFQQHETGDMMVERPAAGSAMRVPGHVNFPTSMRLVGGMGALIELLRQRLDAPRMLTGEVVRRMRCDGQQVELDTEDAGGRVTRWRVEHALVALPPRLAEATIEFSPALPQDLARQWRATATWMAAHAKYIAIYDSPFWRQQGLSGEARSALGPLVEIHDASMPGGGAALFGFFGLPAQLRQCVPEALLRQHCRSQLVRLFGAQASACKADFIKDWSREPFTATSADLVSDPGHARAPASMVEEAPWSGRMTGIASEWSPQFPGYVAGAIEAASLGVQALPRFLRRRG